MKKNGPLFPDQDQYALVLNAEHDYLENGNECHPVGRSHGRELGKNVWFSNGVADPWKEIECHRLDNGCVVCRKAWVEPLADQARLEYVMDKGGEIMTNDEYREYLKQFGPGGPFPKRDFWHLS